MSITPVRLQKEGAETRVASEVADRLERYFAEVDQQHPRSSEADANAALDEAMRSVRPGYTPQA